MTQIKEGPTMSSAPETPIRVGDEWVQVNFEPGDKKPVIRLIEITKLPTPSTPVSYRIVRNDAHPHHVGKHASIRRSELHRKYQPVNA